MHPLLIQIQCPLVLRSNFDNHWYYFILESIFVELVAQAGRQGTLNSQYNSYIPRDLKIYFHTCMYQAEFQRALKLIPWSKVVTCDGFLWQRPASSCPRIRLYSRMYQKQHWDTVSGQSPHPLVGQDRSNSAHWLIIHSVLSTPPNFVMMLPTRYKITKHPISMSFSAHIKALQQKEKIQKDDSELLINLYHTTPKKIF